MQTETLIQLMLFAAATLYTPGPNNIMLASSGARFGFRRTVPHLLGVALGFSIMLFLISLGLGEAFERSAAFREALRWVGAAVMLWIGWKIATAGRAQDGGGGSRPFTFVEAAGFQWINPKAWSICIAIAASFLAGAAPLTEATLCAVIYATVGMSSAAVWVGFGTAIRRFLSTERRFRAFNMTMGLLVAGCVVMLFME